MNSAARAPLEALRSSVAGLHQIASAIPAADLTGRAYPSAWTKADVLSHLGSGAVIMQRRVEDTIAGRATPDEFSASVWDTWNAKSPAAQRDDALAADAALLARLEAASPQERSTFSVSMGPLTLGFEEFVGMRLNEHAFHTWDIVAADDPGATIPPPIAALVVDNLALVARFTGRPTGDTTTITVATTEPERAFRIELTPEAVTFSPTGAAPADLTLPAEAFARLLYGRLDAAHTPSGIDDAVLDVLRRVFPGP